MKALVGVVTFLAVAAVASAGEAYTGYREGYSYDFQHGHYVKVVREVVPFPVPANLFLSITPGRAIPPVTIAPSAYEGVQKENKALLERLESLEKNQQRLIELASKPAAGEVRRDLPPPAKRPVRPRATRAAKPSGPAMLPQAAAILKAHCSDCHSSKKPRGGVTLFDGQGSFTPGRLSPAAIWESVSRENEPADGVYRMPKNRPALEPEELEVIRAWAEAKDPTSSLPGGATQREDVSHADVRTDGVRAGAGAGLRGGLLAGRRPRCEGVEAAEAAGDRRGEARGEVGGAHLLASGDGAADRGRLQLPAARGPDPGAAAGFPAAAEQRAAAGGRRLRLSLTLT